MLVRPGLAADVAAVITMARDAPSRLVYASAGAGQTIHLCAERFARLAGVHLAHRPYAAGSRAGLEALARGEVDLMFDNVTASLDMVRAGKVVALAVAGASRSALLPDLPALGDLLPGYAADIWMGFFALPGAPTPLVESWRGAFGDVLSDPALHADLATLGLDVDGRTGDDFARAIADNARQWRHIVAECGLEST
jgi:tripartite-type tricarboxylate transporter receptor subunit TctC